MKPLPRLRLPSTDLDVSALCLGTAEFGTDIIGDHTDKLVADFMDAGGNFFDTAHCYAFWKNGLGASERELGATLRRLGILDEAIIATKGGHPDNGTLYRRPADFLSEAVIASDIDDSLNRLGIDRIPLYYLHRDDGKTPVENVIDILNRQIAQGRLRYLGASNWSVKRIAEANTYAAERGLQGFVVSQIQGSLIHREPPAEPPIDPTNRFVGAEEIAWHAASGVPLVLYSATANGFFAGRGHDKKSGSASDEENKARYKRAVVLSVQRDCPPTQVALAYLMKQSAPIIPLFSTGSRAHLAEAIGAVDVALSPDDVAWLRDGQTNGERGTGK